MRHSEVTAKLEQLSPLSFAEGWDNTGFLVGRQDKEIKKVCIAVDPSEPVIMQAIREKADLLLTHHPLIFKPLNRIMNEDFIGRRIYMLIRHDICHYAMHTNFDVMGMADAAADLLGLHNRQVLEVTYEDNVSQEGIGRVGRLPHVMTLRECAELVKLRFSLDHVRVYGDSEQTVERAAIVPGSYAGALEQAVRSGAEVLITGDVKHHMGLDALAQKLLVIDAGHYGLEKIFVANLTEYFKREMPDISRYEAIEEPPDYIL